MRRWLAFALFVTSTSCGGHSKNTVVTPPPTPEKKHEPAAPVVREEPLPPAPAFRLPGDVVPTEYAAHLDLDPTKDTFGATITISLSVKQPTRVVWLNANDLKITKAVFSPGGDARVVAGNDDVIGIVPPAALEAGATPKLTIDYTGGVDTQRSRGIYRQNEGDDWYIYTFFEATDARRAFPCFDEPGFKVPWQLTITTKKNLLAATNTKQASESTDGDARTIVFDKTPPLPSYLVAFIVGPFDVVDGGTAGNHGTPLRILVPKGRAGETGYAKQSTPKLVGLLEDYFGMTYPYGKLDVAVVPRYWGTMEHPGIVALGQPLTLIKPGEDTLDRKKAYADIGVHELAHYWFGDYVTCAWWNDTWLNEALGQWTDAKMMEQFEPSWNFQLDRLSEIESAMGDDSLATAQKIRIPVESKHDIESAFSGSITYLKGNAVMAMFEAWMGPDKFQAGVRRYMKEHAWGNATADDFLSAIDAESGKQGTAEAMRTFLDQPGLPLITATLDCKKGSAPTLALTQERYLPRGSKGSADQLWKLPVCARWPGGHACTLLTEKAGSLALDGAKQCPAWIDANAGATGYYRVRYQGDAAKKIMAAAKQLDVRERMALVSDEMALIEAGDAPLADGLAMIPALAADPERHIFRSALDVTRLVRSDLLDDAAHAKWEKFIAKTYGARAKQLGWKSKAGESDDTRQVRPTVMALVAIGAEDKALQAEAVKLARAWLADHKAVDADMVGVVLGAAAHHGDRKLYDEVLDAAKKAPDREERARLVGTLGAFDDPAIAKDALDLVLSGTFDLRESGSIVFGLFGGRHTREIAYAWLKDHFDGFAKLMRDDELMWTIAGIAGSFCDQAHRDDAAAFFGERAKKVDGAEQALQNALEGDDLCIARWKDTAPEVAAFLKKY
jgi:aminopeptidase N